MFKVELDGIKRLLERATPEYLLAQPLRRFMDKSGRLLTAIARQKAEPFSRQVASSINYEVDSSPVPLWVSVRPQAGLLANVLEHGTGLLSEAPDSKGGVHFPPWGEANPGLEAWAASHGLPNGFVVARAIARRGGLRPRRFLREALAEATEAIRGFIGALGAEIGERWRGK